MSNLIIAPWRKTWLILLLTLTTASPFVVAQSTQPAESQSTTAEKKADKPAKPARYASKAFGVRVEPEPPSYVKTLDKFGLPSLAEMDWLEFGLEQQTRFEYRDDNYLQPEFKNDEQFLMRTRGYVGIKKILDPLRFGLEFQDARQFHSEYPETNRDVNEADFLQAFGELYFKDALGKDQPLSFRVGRMTLEYVDRRQVGRNRWRNTVNAFDGFRMRMGEPASDWQFDFFAVQPVDRRMRKPDRGDEERWFYGLIGTWRSWDKYITLEPYWFILDEDRDSRAVADREIHNMGLHFFGPIGKTGFDYDTDVAFQFGHDGSRKQRAFASYSELGYTFNHKWKPRLSVSGAYATGDRNPNDDITERFDRMFQPGHCYAVSDLFVWSNMISPRIRLETKPTDKLRFETSYGAFWLASDSDTWLPTTRRDRTGRSGDGVGQELDARIRYQLDPRMEIEIGYSHFMPGEFPKNTGDADDVDLFYVQTTLKL